MQNKEQKEIKTTSIEDLKRYQAGKVVELPPFAAGQPFYARLRRPSMLCLIKAGKIPNSLLSKAEQLFNGEVKATRNGENPLGEVINVLDIMCESMFVEPTFKELKENKIELTDEQYTFLFNYSQRGVDALKPFHHG